MDVCSPNRVRCTPLFGALGPRPNEVRMQPGRRDCYLLAAAQTVAAQHPQLLKDAIVAHEGAVMVHPPGTDAPVLLKGSLSRWQGRRATEALWPAAVEAGYAFACGGAHVLLVRGEPSDALRYLTGLQAATFAVTVGHRELTERLAAFWERGACIVLHTRKHAFAVVGATRSRGVAALQIMDPKQRWWQHGNHRAFSCNRVRSLCFRAVAYSVTGGSEQPAAVASPVEAPHASRVRGPCVQ